MKSILALALLALAAPAVADEQATVTFSGKGKAGVEVRDSKGQVTDVVGTSNLRLNQIPADAVAREEAHRARQAELTAKQRERRAERRAAEAAAAEEAAKAEEKAQAETVAAQAAATKKFEEEHPRKVRRTTVRGNRYTPKPDNASAPAAETAPAESEAPAGDSAPEDAASPK